MKVRVINSGSMPNGNCYLFETSNATLIVELGVAFKQVKAALNFDFKNVCGAIVTHEHGDHAVAIKDAVSSGVNVYASEGTIKATGIQSHRLNAIKSNVKFKVGPFTILPFNVVHDAAEPLGFLINHPESGNTLFITDTHYVEYKFKNLNSILIEANYSEKIVKQRLSDGKINNHLYRRVTRTHMSVETCIDLLLANDLSQVNNIMLIHLSNGNSDANLFKKQVIEATGKSVCIADKGVIMNLNKTPF